MAKPNKRELAISQYYIGEIRSGTIEHGVQEVADTLGAYREELLSEFERSIAHWRRVGTEPFQILDEAEDIIRTLRGEP